MFASTRLIHIDMEAIFNMIYPLAAFENCTLTMEEFKRAVGGEMVPCGNPEDVLLAKNMEAACNYMLGTLSEPVSVEYAYRINELLTQGRITGDQIREEAVGVEDLEIIKILRACGIDLSGYDLERIVPSIPKLGDLDPWMNISKETYHDYVTDYDSRKYEKYAYDCFMPMIRGQYFKKSNIITGALIVCKIVLQTKEHLILIEPHHKECLARVLLECIVKDSDLPFQEFVQIMVEHHLKLKKNSNVKVMIHYD